MRILGLLTMLLSALTLAGCDNNNDHVLQGWVEAELILCRRTSRDVLKH
jgi:hypothetical protein